MKIIVLLIALALASCGGTFSLSPDGTVSYTTPILRAPIVPEK